MAYVDNVARMMGRAIPADWHAGSLWYPTAHGMARRMAARLDVSLEQAAYAIASLSPRTDWDSNVAAAWTIADIIAAGGSLDDVLAAHLRVTRVNRRKAWTILTTGDLDAIGNGPKTRAFADNIAYPWQSTAVTVDGWAYRIAAGLIGVTDEFKTALRGRVYDEVAAAYREVADRWNFLPLTIQAITWVTAHRLEGRT